ncbi:MAG TPA: prolipoprotein diacylglyceryl transferase family protein [Candidatus Binatia bacterium]|nr:prolipoprotein diacylglyceryl transferase family protein [Candidatus Binatia bacterium]
MLPILFQFGPLTIYSFGVFMALAALAAAWVVQAELKRNGYNPELASTMVFAAAIGGLVGARILFIVEDWSNFLRSPWDYIFTGAGFTWYGGFLGGVLGVSWVVRKNNIPWLKAADIAAPALAIAYGVGRLGCHVAGDGDWGTVTDLPWGVAYKNAIIGWVDPSTGIPYPPGVRVHPTPIYEFLESVLIFGILWALRKKEYAPGTLFWLYLALSGLARLVVEFWRLNPVVGFGLTEAQWFGAAMILVGLWRLVKSGTVTARSTA